VSSFISVDNETALNVALRILTRALDRRYGGPVHWKLNVEHTDVDPNFTLFLTSGDYSRNRDIAFLVSDAKSISKNIDYILNDFNLRKYFKIKFEDHVSDKEMVQIRKLHRRHKFIGEVLK